MPNEDDRKDPRPVATNRRAFHDYFVDDRLEAGIVLRGCEVKSLRAHAVSMGDAYATVDNGEVWLHGMRISAYPAARDNPPPGRPRKLLLNRNQIRRLQRTIREKGHTLIPLKIYFSDRGLAKVQIGLCRGKRQYDKREAIAERDYKRRTDRAIAERQQGR